MRIEELGRERGDIELVTTAQYLSRVKGKIDQHKQEVLANKEYLDQLK